jgi:hypothetical protein
MKAKHEFKSHKAYREYLRAFFAGIALQGYLASYAQEWWKNEDADNNHAAKKAVEYADALLEKLIPPKTSRESR